MKMDAQTIVQVFEVIGALATCIGVGFEIFTKKSPQKVAVQKATIQKTPCHTMG